MIKRIKEKEFEGLSIPVSSEQNIVLFYRDRNRCDIEDSRWEVFNISRFITQFNNHCHLLDISIPQIFKGKGSKIRVLDLCTGVGSYAMYVGKKYHKIIEEVCATEINPLSIKLFQKNTESNELKKLVHIHPVIDKESQNPFPPSLKGEKFDLIIANPPYVPVPDIMVFPKWATGGFLGLDVISEIMKEYAAYLSYNGVMIWVTYLLGSAKFEERNIFSTEIKIDNPEIISNQNQIIKKFINNSINILYTSLPPAWNGYDRRFTKDCIDYQKYLGFISNYVPAGNPTDIYTEQLRSNKLNYLHNFIIESFPKKNETSGTFIIKNLENEYLDEIMILEDECWPDNLQASRKNIKSRITHFGKGFFGCFTITGELTGFATSQIIELSDSILRETSISHLPILKPFPWMNLDIYAESEITQTHNLKGNCLHFVSGCISKKFRSLGLWKALLKARIVLSRQLQLEFCAVLSRLSDSSKVKCYSQGIGSSVGFSRDVSF
jgi:SAM-dependent methyltransferase